VHHEGAPAAWEAASTMQTYQIDLNHHKTRQISQEDIAGADIIIALDPSVLPFLRKWKVGEEKLRKSYVDDPVGGDAGRYEECADKISIGLESLTI
jgi:protein-tyrosine-phosphatase